MESQRWYVEIAFESLSSSTYTISAVTAGEALDMALHRHRDWHYGTPPKFPRYTVRPQDMVDLEHRAEQAAMDARSACIERWRELNS